MTLKWPVPVYPEPDEILSSWLVRAALALGCDPLSLTAALWPGWRAWLMDIDRSLSSEHLRALSGSSGLSPDDLTRMTLLRHLDGKLFLHGKDLAVLPWVISIGSRARQHAMGAQFCPECLLESPPYHRWQWRLAWFTHCPVHQCVLVANCPVCHTPVQYHRLTVEAPHVGVCFSCGYDFTKTQPQFMAPESMTFQALAIRVWNDGVADWGSEQISTADWFALVKFLIHLIRQSAMQKNTFRLARFVQSTGIDLASRPMLPTQLAIEHLSINERACLFAAAIQMISLGSETLIQLLTDAGVSRNSLMSHRLLYPALITRWLADLPEHHVPHSSRPHHTSKQCKSRERVLREWTRLLRKLGIHP